MLERVGEGVPTERRQDAVVRLVACEDRLWAEEGEITAEAEAVVWEAGQCTLSPTRLAKLLATYRYEPSVTIQASGQGLHVGSLFMPVTSHSPWALAPGANQPICATD